ncbi:MAG: hypothetical protein J6L24_03830, partial [Oscillospiraceae bacterium]|nr:hypothetical protein [Oscillospiraceae bacterium]
QKCRLGQAFFLHNLGIGFPRYVFPVFGTARLGQKIRRSAADDLFKGSLITVCRAVHTRQRSRVAHPTAR